MDIFYAVDKTVKLLDKTVFSYQDIPDASNRENEIPFLLTYDLEKYGLTEKSEVFTADACMFTIVNDELKVLLIQRGNHPFKGYWCLPGGFVDSTDDTIAAASVRELAEETGIEAVNPEFVGVYNYSWRDPRMENIISTCYAFFVKEEQTAVGSDDATDAAWVSVEDVLADKIQVGFDHKLLIMHSVKKLFLT